MFHILEIIQNRIDFLKSAIRIEEITTGFSSDKKYVVFFSDDINYLLRIGSIKDEERKNTEFQVLSELKKIGVRAPKPIEKGSFEELGVCYCLFSYIEGENAKAILPTYSAKKQYEIGFEAGKDLARIHSYPAPEVIQPWYDRAMKKHFNYLDAYKTCGIKINNDEKVIQFIENNAHYIKSRPNYLQHDDFHLENIIVQDKQYVGVIDFNGFDWGDPLHDFVKVALFQREISESFSIGQIQGYYENNIPQDFWMLYSIYVAMTIFSTVVWSLRVSPEQLDKMIERISIVLEDHKNFELLIPTWYKSEILFT